MRIKDKIRMLLMSGMAKGFIKKVSGYAVELAECIGIKSVTVTTEGAIGETLNLADMKDYRASSDKTLSVCTLDGVKLILDGTVETAGGGRNGYLSKPITLEAGKTYTLAWYYVSGTCSGTVPKLCMSKTATGGYYGEAAMYNRNYSYSFTASADTEIQIGINHIAGAVYSNYCGYAALYEGSYTNNTLPEYEPGGCHQAYIYFDGQVFSVYMPIEVGSGETVTVDFEKRTVVSSTGLDASDRQVWDKVPQCSGTVEVSAESTVDEAVDVTYYSAVR